MPALRQSRQPANDQPSPALQRMSFVVLPRPRRTRLRFMISTGMLGLLVAASLTAFIMAPRPAPQIQAAIAPAPAKPEPYDISLNASDLQPPDAATQLAEQLPVNVTAPKDGDGYRPGGQRMEISVAAAPAPSPQRSALCVAQARAALEQGDIEKAIAYQTEAVNRAPDNAYNRLQLAILLDRDADRENAVENYRQVIAAYDAHSASLPAALNIDDIRRRLAYLSVGDNAAGGDLK